MARDSAPKGHVQSLGLSRVTPVHSLLPGWHPQYCISCLSVPPGDEMSVWGQSLFVCRASRQAGCGFSVRQGQREEAGIRCFARPAQWTCITSAVWPPLFEAQWVKYEHASHLPLPRPTGTSLSPANVNSTISTAPGMGTRLLLCMPPLLSSQVRWVLGVFNPIHLKELGLCPVKVGAWAHQAAHTAK